MNCLTCGNNTFCNECGFCRICTANRTETMEADLKLLRSQLAEAEKVIKGYCMCESEWVMLDDRCAFCKYRAKYPKGGGE